MFKKITSRLKIKSKSGGEKFLDSIIILNANGFPIYSDIKNNRTNNYLDPIFYSGFLSAIVNVSKQLNAINELIYVKLKKTELFLYCSQNDFVFLLAFQRDFFKVNRKSKLVNDLLIRLNQLFSAELAIKDWSVITKELKCIIKNKIDSIFDKIFNKLIVSFYF